MATNAVGFPLTEADLMNQAIENHAFSVELTHREHLKTLNIPSNPDDVVIIEGWLGKLLDIALIEDSMLEIQGANGTLRIDICRIDFAKILQRKVEA